MVWPRRLAVADRQDLPVHAFELGVARYGESSGHARQIVGGLPELVGQQHGGVPAVRRQGELALAEEQEHGEHRQERDQRASGDEKKPVQREDRHALLGGPVQKSLR